MKVRRMRLCKATARNYSCSHSAATERVERWPTVAGTEPVLIQSPLSQLFTTQILNPFMRDNTSTNSAGSQQTCCLRSLLSVLSTASPMALGTVQDRLSHWTLNYLWDPCAHGQYLGYEQIQHYTCKLVSPFSVTLPRWTGGLFLSQWPTGG